MSSTTDTRPVRPSEELDWEKLAGYLRRELHDPRLDAPMTVEQFSGGHSNLTYALRFGDFELVLRRPPFGPVPPRAHDMAREFRVLETVHPHFPLAPKPHLLCEDTSITGSIFYVMERRHGVVIREAEPPSIEGSPQLRRRVSASVIDTIVDLHAIDVVTNRLDVLGRPVGFVERQIRGWIERWQRAKTSDIDAMEFLSTWLEARIPADPPEATLVHGDYKLDNVMLAADDPTRVVGVFDWEMSAIGDPLVDLGIILCYWVHAAGGDALPGVTKREGWFTREEIIEHYAGKSRRNISEIALYEVFAVFKLAVVVQQIYARFVRGQTDDPRFRPLGEHVSNLARVGARLAARS